MEFKLISIASLIAFLWLLFCENVLPEKTGDTDRPNWEK